jgi:DNA-binding MarR family transcriptional regulator
MANSKNSSVIATQVLKSLRQIMRSVDLQSQKLRRSIGLTGPQLMVINEVGKNEGLTAGELSKAVNLTQATVTSVLDRLEARGYVNRIRSSIDRRRVSLSLTEKARDILSTGPSYLQEEFLEKFYSLEDWEQSQILASLQRISNLMGAHELPVEPILAISDFEGESLAPES